MAGLEDGRGGGAPLMRDMGVGWVLAMTVAVLLVGVLAVARAAGAASHRQTAASTAPRLSDPLISTRTYTGGFNTTGMWIDMRTDPSTRLVQKSMTNPGAFEKGGPVPADGHELRTGLIHYEVLSPSRGETQSASLTYDGYWGGAYIGEVTMKVHVTHAWRDNVTFTCEVRRNLDNPYPNRVSLGCWFDDAGNLFNVGDDTEGRQDEE
jgi:hypothetical protein